MSCVVPNCRCYFRLLKKTGENTSLHRFPENHLREKWIEALGRDNWTPKEHNRICSKHFESDCFVFTNNKRLLLPNAIPTIFLRPLERYHPKSNRESDKGNNIKMILSSNERLPVEILKTSPQPLQESDTDDDKEIIAYTSGSLMNQQSEGTDSEKTRNGDENLLDVIFKTSPQPIQESDYDLPNVDYDKEIMGYNLGSHLDQQSEDEDKKNILSADDKVPGAMPSTLPLQVQMTCQNCMSITTQYEEKMLKQEHEIKYLSSELEEMKRLLEKSDKDLERVKEVSKKRLQTIWKLRKRNERNLIYPKDYILL